MKKVEKSENDKKRLCTNGVSGKERVGRGIVVIIYRNEKEKKMKKYLPRLSDDLPRNLLQVLPFCFRGVQRIDHKLELSPRAHYIVKHIKNEVLSLIHI